MAAGPVRITAGLGCRHGVSADSVIEALQQASRRCGRQPDSLAIPQFKRAEPGLLQAAARLGLPLLRVTHAALRAEQPRCVTASPRVAAATGVGSIAEACALASAGPGSRLLAPRIAWAGVTCALAVSDDPA